MHIGIFGSGIVGQTVGRGLARLGHQVTIGTRDPRNLGGARGQAPSLQTWLAEVGPAGRVDTFAGAAQSADLLINATSGSGSLAALESAQAGVGSAGLENKVLLDLANPLDFSQGLPPTLFVKDGDSLAEGLQRAHPELLVVKALNTMSAHLMVAPGALAGGDHTVFLSGNDAGAKAQVRGLLESLGWTDILDLGDLSTARGPEMLLPLWLRTWQALGTADFQFKVVR